MRGIGAGHCGQVNTLMGSCWYGLVYCQGTPDSETEIRLNPNRVFTDSE